MHQGQDVWQLKAACRGPQAAVFFPPSHAERKEEKASREMRAKTICDQCRVRGACLDYAIGIREPHGIWGGLNEMERKLMLDRRATSPRPPDTAIPGSVRRCDLQLLIRRQHAAALAHGVGS